MSEDKTAASDVNLVQEGSLQAGAMDKKARANFAIPSAKRVAAAVLAFLLPIVILMSSILVADKVFSKPLPQTEEQEELGVTEYFFEKTYEPRLFTGVTRTIDEVYDKAELLSNPITGKLGNTINALIGEDFDIPTLICINLAMDSNAETDSSNTEITIKTILYSAFFIRIGLAALAMYILCRRSILLNEIMSLLLSIAYSLSAMALSLAQETSAMNMVIFLPLVVLAIDLVVRASTPRSILCRGTILTVLVFISIMTGFFGLWYSVGYAVLFAVFLSICVSGKFSTFLVRFVNAMRFVVLGIMLGAPFYLNLFSNSHIDYVLADIWESKSRTTIFDFLQSMLIGNGIGNNLNYPNLYFTIFALLLVVLFFYNKIVPLRVKICALVSILIVMLTYSFTSISTLLTLFAPKGQTITAESARMIGLVLFLLLIAGISIRNLAHIDSQIYVRAAVAISIFVVIAEVNLVDVVRPKIAGALTILLVIAYALVFKSKSLSKSTTKHDNILFAVFAFGILFNTSYEVLFARFDRDAFVDYSCYLEDGTTASMLSTYSSQSSEELDDLGLGIFAEDVNSQAEYLILSTDASDYNPYMEKNYLELINYVSRSTLQGRVLFEPASNMYDLYASDVPMIGNQVISNADSRVNVLRNVILTEEEVGKPIVICSTYRSNCFLTLSGPELEINRSFNGPFIFVLPEEEADPLEFNIRIGTYENEIIGQSTIFDLATNDLEVNTGEDAFAYFINEEVLAELTSRIKPIDSEDFSLDLTNLSPTNTEKRTVITSIPYTSGIKVQINGLEAESFSMGGYLAFNISALSNKADVHLSSSRSEFGIGIIISLVALALLLINYAIEYIDFKKKADWNSEADTSENEDADISDTSTNATTVAEDDISSKKGN